MISLFCHTLQDLTSMRFVIMTVWCLCECALSFRALAIYLWHSVIFNYHSGVRAIFTILFMLETWILRIVWIVIAQAKSSAGSIANQKQKKNGFINKQSASNCQSVGSWTVIQWCLYLLCCQELWLFRLKLWFKREKYFCFAVWFIFCLRIMILSW